MPTDKKQTTVIKENRDGSIVIQYHPTEKGHHEMAVNFNDQPVEVEDSLQTFSGTPFKCIVDSVTGGYVTAYGSGLTHGMAGEKTNFTVVSAGGDRNKANITIDGPSKVDLNRKDTADGTSLVEYMPLTPGEYSITVKHGGKHISGSPFTAKVSGAGRKRSQIFVNALSEKSLNVKENDIVNLYAAVKAPSGGVEQSIVKKLESGQLALSSFSPKEEGEYTASVYRDEKHISGSPFKIKVGPNDVGKAAKVKVKGAFEKAAANQLNALIIDASAAGYGGLGVSIEGSHRSDMSSSVDGKVVTVNFAPHEPGMFILNVRYADEHVTGSPFLVDVSGESSGRVRKTIEQDLPACEPVGVGQVCDLSLKIPGTSPFDMEASVTSPSGTTDLCDIMDLEGSVYDIKFTPKEEGRHTISIKYKGLHVSGSPFPFTVGAHGDGGISRVEVGGPGLERGEAGSLNEFNVYTHEAGAGQLTVAVEGPSKAELTYGQRPNGCGSICYKVTHAGKYGIHVKFNDKHIPKSPFFVYVAPDSGDAKKVTVHAIQDRGLVIGKPTTFTVQYNGATGKLHAHVFTPSGGEEDAYIQEMDKETYAVRFIPKENGVHYVHVKLSEAHIPGSPFPFLVGKLAADPAMVIASGDGLDKGLAGRKCKFSVNTVQAGPGVLTVTIEGPSRVAISCREMDEGYEFSYSPMAAGEYTITIKFGNINIAGSPSIATITGTGRKASPIIEQATLVVETVEKKPGSAPVKKFTGDASKVIAKGPALQKGFLGRASNFTIEVKDAGQGLLLIGLIGPNGEPEEELNVKHTSKTVYQVSYKARVKGEHRLYVRWGEDEIPGSPFSVKIS